MLKRVVKMQTNNVFKHSGRFSVGGLFSTILKGAVVAALLGGLYGVIGYYSPFFIINMCVLIGIAIAMGMLLQEFVRSGHIRSNAIAALVGAATGGVLLAVQWIVWLRLTVEFWVLDFATILNAIQVVGLLGPWSVFGWTPTGTSLYVIWGIEALLIVVMPTVMARNTVRDTPYCEQTGQWADVEYTQKKFASCDIGGVKEQLLQNPSAVVSLLKEPSEQDSEFLKFGLGKVAGSSLRTVTISKIVAKIKDGKVEEDSKTVLNNLMVDATTFDKMAAACK